MSAYATIVPLRWSVFVEQPLEEAFAGLYASIQRTVGLLVLGVMLAVAASLLLARRMVTPIQALQAGAARIGAGELDQRIDIRSRDELEALADQFNSMAAQLKESYAGLERKVEARTRELSEALEQQTATAEILRVISSSPTDLAPVMEAVAENAARVCGASDASIFRMEGEELRRVARFGSLPNRAPELIPLSRAFPAARCVIDRQTIHIDDISTLLDTEFSELRDSRVAPGVSGVRTVLATPLLREGAPIGAILIRRTERQPFTEKQIALLKTFADQAVIAIENVRLFNELEVRNRALTTALDQQTATGEILTVISSSPTDVQPVFDAILSSAVRLCDAIFGVAYRYDGELIHIVGHHNYTPEALATLQAAYPIAPRMDTPTGRAILERSIVQVEDATQAPWRPESRALARQLGYRALLGVPMMREGAPIGLVVVARRESIPFTEQQLDLVKTFADQAVIAIENVRLFTELQERNREVTEALEQQTATAEILRVISSSPTDVQPVLDAVAESAARLCETEDVVIFRQDGDRLRLVAHHGPMATATVGQFSLPMHPGSVGGRAVIERRIVHVPDILHAGDEFPESFALARERLAQGRQQRTLLAVPLLREGQAIGMILLRRPEVRLFSDKQVTLLQSFADQAVIAIENVRLFQELQSRTRQLARSVEELQALGEVGRAVSSTLDVETVLSTIVSRANQLSGTDGGAIYEYDEAAEEFHLRATQNLDAELVEILRSTFIRRGEGVMGRLAETREPIQVPDIVTDPSYQTRLRETVVRTGYRALLAVPLLRENRIMGGLVVNRKTPGQFAPEVIELLRTFAAQSALAIQNARLFQEIEEKSRQLEVANRHKSEFLASMSHELRTPLNAVIGFSEVLLDRMFGEINPKQDEYLQDILSSGRHLLSLINDILDLAKIEAGRMELDVADFHLPQAIDNAITLVRERAARRAIALEADVDARLGEIKGDERKVKQVLLNLLSNAIKFTPEGGHIGVHAALADGFAEISVTDTGVGIAPEDHEAVFEEFRQVGTDYAKKHEGTGLGLTLSRRFVELHGGKIWVKSQLGLGATFTFTLPVKPWQTS
jgi:two-component system, NtrC family, sensor kinase